MILTRGVSLGYTLTYCHIASYCQEIGHGHPCSCSMHSEKTLVDAASVIKTVQMDNETDQYMNDITNLPYDERISRSPVGLSKLWEIPASHEEL